MPFGTRLLPEGSAEFRVWAPAARCVELLYEGDAAAAAAAYGDGWFVARREAVRAGARYAFRLGDGHVLPDPAARRRPRDGSAACELVDPAAYDWRDDAWHGRPWHEAVLYEIDVGTFTSQGTFGAAIGHLPDLAQLGVTALVLARPAQAADRDGGDGREGAAALPFAPDGRLGRPEDLKRLVDEAHGCGLSVLMEIECGRLADAAGLRACAPACFAASRRGRGEAAPRLGDEACRPLREFIVHQALYWLDEYRCDGVRLDASASVDPSCPDIVDEIVQRVRDGPGRARDIHVLLRNPANEAHRLGRDADGHALGAIAQCNDDLHDAAHVVVTGDRRGVYADYAGDPVRCLARALAQGFAYQGEPSPSRRGAPRGECSLHLPPLAFVNRLERAERTSARAARARLPQRADPAAARALTACLLLAPSPPLLFMGQEFAATTPVPVPGRGLQRRSVLDWVARERGTGREALAFTRRLLALRRDWLQPWLPGARCGSFQLVGDGCVLVRWPLAGARVWHLLANLHPEPARFEGELPAGAVVHASHDALPPLPPWAVRFSLEAS